MTEPTITYEDRNLASKIFACPDHFKLPAIAAFREAAYEAGKLAGAKAMQAEAVSIWDGLVQERRMTEVGSFLANIDPATIAKEAGEP